MKFELPEILKAERAGRAIALSLACDCEATVSTSLAGAASMAALRHLHNMGRNVFANLCDYNAQSLDTFSTMLEVYACMDLSLMQTSGENILSAAPAWIDGSERTGPGPAKCPDKFIDAAEWLMTCCGEWDGFSMTPEGRDSPYLALAEKEKAFSAAAVRDIDYQAMNDYSLPGICLMENAGTGAAVVAVDMLSAGGISTEDKPVLVIAGYGNNGGDGLVVARALLEKGERVRVLLLGDPLKLKGDAAENLRILSQAEGIAERAPEDAEELQLACENASLIVDGIFGTGLSRNVEGLPALAINAINSSSALVLALDLPSGLNADTGEVMGVCVRAQRTVTFAAPKKGFWLACGPENCGEIRVADIGCPKELLLK